MPTVLEGGDDEFVVVVIADPIEHVGGGGGSFEGFLSPLGECGLGLHCRRDLNAVGVEVVDGNPFPSGGVGGSGGGRHVSRGSWKGGYIQRRGNVV